MISPCKDENETAVPEIWRPTLSALVDSLVYGAPSIGSGLSEVDPLPLDTHEACLAAIEDYADVDLVPLPDETWMTSVASWRGDRWLCLVDLWTKQEGRSDLVLEVEVREQDQGFRFTVIMVYVP